MGRQQWVGDAAGNGARSTPAAAMPTTTPDSILTLFLLLFREALARTLPAFISPDFLCWPGCILC